LAPSSFLRWAALRLLLRQVPQGLVVGLHHATRGFVDLLATIICHGCEDEALTVCGHLEFGVAVDLEQLEDRLLDDDAKPQLPS
jgi:hypothetical protein